MVAVVAAEVTSDSATEAATDVFSLHLEQLSRRRSWRRLALLLREALGLVWAASRLGFSYVVGSQVLSAALAAAQVLVGKLAFDAILSANHKGTSLTAAVPEVIALAAVAAATSLTGVHQQQQQRLLSELVQRRTWARVLDVTQSVELS